MEVPMRNFRAALFAMVLFALVACTSTQIGDVATGVQTACGMINDALALAPVNPITPYAVASCVGADAVSAITQKALADPTTVTWLNNIAADLKAYIP